MSSTSRLIVLVLVVACASLGQAGHHRAVRCQVPCAAPPCAAVPASTSQPTAACEIPPNENLNAVLWVQFAAEYRANALQSYNVARRQMAAALADESWSALAEKASVPLPHDTAVILDLD